MNTSKTKYEENQDYFDENWECLKNTFPSMLITIVNRGVKYVADDDEGSFRQWQLLKPEEQAESYTTYIPKRDAIMI
jgi:hypothetical protein